MTREGVGVTREDVGSDKRWWSDEGRWWSDEGGNVTQEFNWCSLTLSYLSIDLSDRLFMV